MHIDAAGKLRDGSLTNGQLWTLLGYEFEAVAKFDMADTAVKWFSFEVPSSVTDKVIALQTRLWKADNSNVDLDILWDVTSYTGGTDIPIFNSYRDKRISVVEFKEDAAVNATASTVREEDFLASGGTQGNQSSPGQLGPTLGFRLYLPGEYFIGRVTNNGGDDNTIQFGYKWVELPISYLNESD